MNNKTYTPNKFFKVVEDYIDNDVFIYFNDEYKSMFSYSFIDKMMAVNPYWMPFLFDTDFNDFGFEIEVMNNKNFINDFTEYFVNSEEFKVGTEINTMFENGFDSNVSAQIQVDNFIQKLQLTGVNQTSNTVLRDLLRNFDSNTIEGVLAFEALKGNIMKSCLINLA